MNSLARNLGLLAIALLAAIALVVAVLSFPGSAVADGGHRYTCPPCGSPCDTTTFLAPGVCPVCGMTLVEEGSAAAMPDRNEKKVAILVFNSCEILDFAGPYEMFGAADCDVYTVAAGKDPVTTSMGLTIVPRYTFATAPVPDVLVIPGGGVKAAMDDSATLAYIRTTTERTKHTMSVCNGAFILANTGLLDGLTATTTNHNIPRMAEQFPKVKVVRDQRYVDNGRIITTAGLSAGMDGALHVIAKLFGTGTAQQVALAEEYDWQASSKYARAALADQQIPPLPFDSLGTWQVERMEGDTRHWDLVAHGTLKVPAADFGRRMESDLTAARWTRVDAATSHGATRTTHWRFTGNDGKPWKATIVMEPVTGAPESVRASISIARTSSG